MTHSSVLRERPQGALRGGWDFGTRVKFYRNTVVVVALQAPLVMGTLLLQFQSTESFSLLRK